MRFANPAGLLLAALAAPVVLLHMLRPRRRTVVVSSTYLWPRESQAVSAARPWQRPPPGLLLVLQLLAVMLLALAAAQPVRPTATPLQPHTVFVIDASGSMLARDGSPDRLAEAKARARALRRQLPAGGRASVVVASARPAVLLSASDDPRAFARALEAIRATAGPADFATAFSLAAGLETPGTPVGFVLLSDGGLSAEERRLVPEGTRYERVGRRAGNVAVTRLAATPAGSGLQVLVAVRNAGPRPVEATLRLTVDGAQVASVPLRLPPRFTVERTFDAPPGDRLEAVVSARGDLLAADDRAFATAARRPPLRVLMASAGDPFLERLLAAIPGLSVDRVPTSRPADGYDLAIYDRLPLPPDPGAPFWAIAPPGGAPGVRVTGSVDQPAVTLVRDDTELLRGLDLSEVGVAAAQRIEAPADEVLVGAPETPLLVRGTRRGRRFAYLGFPLADSNLPLQVAFPILADRLISDLAGVARPAPDLRVGRPLPVSGGDAVAVEDPSGRRTELAAGSAPPLADRPGFWTVIEGTRPPRLVAVNADPRESDITPARSLPIPPRRARPGERRPGGEAPLLGWVVGAAAVVLAAELVVSRRQSGVPRRQWRAALACRGAIAACLAAAVAGVALPLAARRVAVVFAVDASDSLGPGGRREAIDWVRQALRHQPPGALAGVVFFGGDARLEHVLQPRLRLDGRTVELDTQRTNLAAALRLAGAVLPADARRRVVLVSDGRPTEGDAAAEAEALRGAGIRLDVHSVGRAVGPDVAVLRLDAPEVVRRGEAFVVRGTVTATRPGPVRLTWERGGEVVAEEVRDLPAGDTVLQLAQRAGAEGLYRFRLSAASGSDSVPENDSAYAAVRVVGPPRVLVAEGVPGAGGGLAAALRAGGMEVEVVAASALPGLDRLSSFDAVVLVDVAVLDLSPTSLAALRAAVREAGRGLVVVGGERSYGLGGYLRSELEELLPVESDIRDPRRRKRVAQVLVVDASGSMAEDVGAAPKIDLARAAAARAISTLRSEDRVGVLAFNTEQRWIIPLGPVPPEDEVERLLGSLEASGGTLIGPPLRLAGEGLRGVRAAARHVILLSDGITDEPGLDRLAASLAEEGITVSAVGVGEAANSAQLRGIAAGGKGRYYEAVDPESIPQIITQESVLASRTFINEGTFYPEVVSAAAPVRELRAAPALLGYVATTAKPAATTLLEVGPEHDPLLATWRTGLGRVSAWTSDAGRRWGQAWSRWEGFPGFWAAVVKDVLPPLGGGEVSVRATVEGSRLRVTVEADRPLPPDTVAEARLATPDLEGLEVPLERTSPTTFAGELEAARAGTYAVGVRLTAGGAPIASSVALASRSYPEEYRPASPDPGLLLRLSAATGGRGEVRPQEVWNPEGLPVGRGRVPLAGWLLAAAALLWPLDVALRRLALEGASPRAAVGRAADAMAAAVRRLRARGEPARAGGAEGRVAVREGQPGGAQGRAGAAEPAPRGPAGTVGRLLERRRAERRR